MGAGYPHNRLEDRRCFPGWGISLLSAGVLGKLRQEAAGRDRTGNGIKTRLGCRQPATGLSVCPSLCPSTHPSVHPSIHLPVHPPRSLSVYPLTIHPPPPSVCLSIHPLPSSIRPSIHSSIPRLPLSIHPSVLPSTHPSVYLLTSPHPSIHLSIRLSICPSGGPSTRPSICPSASHHFRRSPPGHAPLSPLAPHLPGPLQCPSPRRIPLARSPWGLREAPAPQEG